MSDNELPGESHQPPRPLAAARNAALSRVDLLLMEPTAPPAAEQSQPRSYSTVGGAGETSGRGVGRGGGYSMPAEFVEAGCDSGGGSCLARSGVMSARAREAPAHQGASSGGEAGGGGQGGGGGGQGGGAEESGRIGESSSCKLYGGYLLRGWE